MLADSIAVASSLHFACSTSTGRFCVGCLSAEPIKALLSGPPPSAAWRVSQGCLIPRTTIDQSSASVCRLTASHGIGWSLCLAAHNRYLLDASAARTKRADEHPLDPVEINAHANDGRAVSVPDRHPYPSLIDCRPFVSFSTTGNTLVSRADTSYFPLLLLLLPLLPFS